MEENAEAVRVNIHEVIDENNMFNGYVDTLKKALDVVRDYELRTTTKFTVYKKIAAFGTAGKSACVVYGKYGKQNFQNSPPNIYR